MNNSAKVIQKSLSGYSVTLVAVDEANQHLLFKWRNEPSIRQKMVNQSEIALAQHQQWYKSLKNKTDMQHFVIFYKNIAIGAINIKSKNEESLLHCAHAQVGIYIAHEKYKGNILAFSPSLLINDYAFKQLQIKQLSSKVRADNYVALKYNQQLGYHCAAEEGGFIEISLTADNYDTASKKLKLFLDRGSKIVERKIT